MTRREPSFIFDNHHVMERERENFEFISIIFILINVKYIEISWKERKERYIFCVINVKYKDISWRVRRRKREKVTHRVNSC